MKSTARRNQNAHKRLLGLSVCVLVVFVGFFCTGGNAAVAASSKAKSAKKTTKRPTTRKRVTTKPPATRVSTTPSPTTVAPAPATPSTAVPTTVAPTTVAPTTKSVVAVVGIPTSIGIPTSTAGTPVPTLPANSSPASFERALYTITMPANVPVNASFFLNIAPGFNDTLVLRTPGGTPGLTVTLDRNPVRNFFVMTITGASTAPPLNQFVIEAAASADPNVVLARTNVSVFLTGTTTPAGSIVPPNGDPNAPPGVIYSLSPATVTVRRDGDASSTKISFVRQGNFAGPVTFEPVSVAPVGIGTSFQANSTSLNENYFFVSAGLSTPLGTYVLTFTAVTSLQRVPLSVTVIVVS